MFFEFFINFKQILKVYQKLKWSCYTIFYVYA